MNRGHLLILKCLCIEVQKNKNKNSLRYFVFFLQYNKLVSLNLRFTRTVIYSCDSLNVTWSQAYIYNFLKNLIYVIHAMAFLQER